MACCSKLEKFCINYLLVEEACQNFVKTVRRVSEMVGWKIMSFAAIYMTWILYTLAKMRALIFGTNYERREVSDLNES